MEITLTEVKGKKAIGTSDLVYCNTKYHSPYLAVVRGENMLWQEKLYVGYGKHRETYYNVESLQSGDLIQAAGGSGCNKYPFKGRVLVCDSEKLIVESIDDKDFDNLRLQKKEEDPLTKEEQILVNQLKALAEDRRRLVLNAVRK